MARPNCYWRLGYAPAQKRSRRKQYLEVAGVRGASLEEGPEAATRVPGVDPPTVARRHVDRLLRLRAPDEGLKNVSGIETEVQK